MEFVYVVKRYDLFDLSFPHGFVDGAGDDRRRLDEWTRRIRERGFFLERRQAERDSSFKQIIPYTLVTHGDEVLLLRRLATGGEARLHGKLSIGVGGHINPVDDAPAGGASVGGSSARGGGKAAARGAAPGRAAPGPEDVLAAGCRRELEEELAIDTGYELTVVGAINDESGDVGSVHFGLVHLARCETPAVRVRETDVLEGSFVTRRALRELLAEQPERFETWSALIVPHLDEILR